MRDLRKLMVWRQTRDGVLHTQAAALRLGDVLLNFMPGEVFLQLGDLLREELGQPPLINAAYCFGSNFGYVVPPEAFAPGRLRAHGHLPGPARLRRVRRPDPRPAALA